MTSINEQELGWLAGIADGEGSFYLSLTKSGDFDVFKMSFAVGNTNILIIEELKRLYQILLGKEIRYVPIKGRGNRKSSWLIQITSQEDMRKFCEVMLPRLVGKVEQCKTMIEYLNLGPAHRGSGNRDVELFERRKTLVAKMHRLNRYRVGDESPARDRTVSPDSGDETIRSSQQCGEVARNGYSIAVGM